MLDVRRAFAVYVPRSDREAHHRLIEEPPRYSVEWVPPAGSEIVWGDRIVFGSTDANCRVKPGGWAAATIRFRVYTVMAFLGDQSAGVPLAGGHDDFEVSGAELGELTEELRLSANRKTTRQLHIPAWLPFVVH